MKARLSRARELMVLAPEALQPRALVLPARGAVGPEAQVRRRSLRRALLQRARFEMSFSCLLDAGELKFEDD